MPLYSTQQIGKIIRDASQFDPKKWYGDAHQFDSLVQSVETLFSLLEERKIAYVLVGGIAMLHYIDGRNTQDVDLLMAVQSLSRLPEIKVISRDDNFIRGELDRLQIDILSTSNPLFKLVQERYVKNEKFMDREVPIASVDGLLLLKLYALPSLYRQGDFTRVGLYENDIATLLHDYASDVEPLLKVLSTYLDQSDMVELNRIIAEIQEKLARFGKNKPG